MEMDMDKEEIRTEILKRVLTELREEEKTLSPSELDNLWSRESNKGDDN